MTQEQWIAGRYRCLYKLGRGGFSEVFLAEDVRLGNRKVALKRVAAHLIQDDERILKFQQEAQIIGHLTNPFTVRAFDFGEDEDGRYYIAMEYVQGETLHEILKRERRLSIERSVKAGVQILDALSEAHQMGVIHRDLKPKNVMLVPQRHGDLIKVLDFGVARILRGDLEPGEDEWTLVGTATYMAPEQAQGFPVSPASDIYSVGVIMYHMLTGRPPFTSKEDPVAVMIHHALSDAPSMRKICPELDLPEELDRLVLRALEKKPDDRFQQAAEFCNELENFWELWFREHAHSLIEEAETFNNALDPDEQTRKDRRRPQANGVGDANRRTFLLGSTDKSPEHTLDRNQQDVDLDEADIEPPTRAENQVALTRETQAVAVSWSNSQDSLVQIAREQPPKQPREHPAPPPKERLAKEDLSTDDLSTQESLQAVVDPVSTQLEMPAVVDPEAPPTEVPLSEAPPPAPTRPRTPLSPLPKPLPPPGFATARLESVAPSPSEASTSVTKDAKELHEVLDSVELQQEHLRAVEALQGKASPFDTLQVQAEDILSEQIVPEPPADTPDGALQWIRRDVDTQGQGTFPDKPVASPQTAPSLTASQGPAQKIADPPSQPSMTGRDWEAPTMLQTGFSSTSPIDFDALDASIPESTMTVSLIDQDNAPDGSTLQDALAVQDSQPRTLGFEEAWQTPATPTPQMPDTDPSAPPAWLSGGLAIPPPTPTGGFSSISLPPQYINWSLQSTNPPKHGSFDTPTFPPAQQSMETFPSSDPFLLKSEEEKANAIFLTSDEFGFTAEFQASLRRRWVGVLGGFVFAVGLIWILASVGGNDQEQQRIQEEEMYRLALREGDQEIASSRYRKAYLSYRRALLLRPNSTEAKRRMRLAKIDLEASSQLRQAKLWIKRRQYWRAYRILLQIDPNTSTAVESKSVLRNLRPHLVESLAQHTRTLLNRREWRKAVIACQRLARYDRNHSLLRRPCRYARRRARRYRRR